MIRHLSASNGQDWDVQQVKKQSLPHPPSGDGNDEVAAFPPNAARAGAVPPAATTSSSSSSSSAAVVAAEAAAATASAPAATTATNRRRRSASSKKNKPDFYTWFQAQCRDMISQRYKKPQTPSSIKGAWGKYVSVKAAYNANDYRSRSAAIRPRRESYIGMNGGPLELIFVFYSKLQKPGVQRLKKSLTFDEINQANTTMSYFELLCTMRDFDVVPNLLSKGDLGSIWKWCKGRRGRTSDPTKVLSELEFRDFLEVLCCVAIVAFSRPALQEGEGRRLDPPACVDALATFMRLSDPKYALRVVRTKGMATSARLNYRSKGETDPAGGSRLRDERDLNRAAELLCNSSHALKHQREREPNIRFKHFNDDDTLRSSKFMVDETRRVWEETRDAVYLEGGSNIAQHLECGEFSGYDFSGGGARGGAISMNGGGTTITPGSSFWSGASTHTKRIFGFDHKDLLLGSYDQSLVDLLLPYKFKLAPEDKPRWMEFSGPFIDFGVLSRRRKSYRACVSITNTGENPIVVTPETYYYDEDGTLRYDRDDDWELEGSGGGSIKDAADSADCRKSRPSFRFIDAMQVSFDPAVVPPGLRTVISLSLAPSAVRKRCILAGLHLEISVAPREQGRSAYRSGSWGTDMSRSDRLKESYCLKIPIYGEFTNDKFGDKVGDFFCKENIKDSDKVKRAGIKIRGSKDKAERVKMEEEFIAGQC